MAGTKFWAQKYLSEGWSPIPIPSGEKGPRIADWERTTFAPADFGDDDNIGVHLGKHAAGPGLYDIDLDDKWAPIAADILLAPTDRIHGRPSKPRSHRFYTCDETLEHFAIHGLGGANDTLVELRGISPNSKAYTQTVIPPSVHPSGEVLAWDQDGKPCHLKEGKPLIDGVKDIGLAVLIARGFPGAGNRHIPRLALAGFLHRAGLEKLRILAIGRAIMRMIGGDEGDWLDTARTTLAKLEADPEATVTGGPTLREMLTDGEATLKKCNLLLGRLDQAAVDDQIERLNKQYFIVTAGATPCVADDSRPDGITLFTFDAFKKVLIKERMPARKIKETKKKDGTLIPAHTKPGRPVADVWLEHPQGRQYDRLVYCPPPLTPGPKDYDGWKGFSVKPEEMPTPLLDYHLKEIFCGGSDEILFWFHNWCAALFQRPGLHAITGVVAQGGQGVGKGLVFHDLLGKMFDLRHYICISSSEQFYGRFAGELLSGRTLVFLDEATWGGDKRDMGTLKDRVTGDFLLVDRKNISQVMERSMLHLAVASNEDWPIGVDADDRRFTILRVVNERANDPTYFGPLYDEIKNGGRAAFLAKMLAWPINEEMLRKPIDTRAKTALKMRSLPPEAEWWQECLGDGKILTTDKSWPEMPPRAAVHTAYLEYVQKLGITRRLGPTRLYKMLLKFCKSATFLKPHGKPRALKLPTLDVAREQFARFLGTDIDWDAFEPDSEPDDTSF